MEQHPIPQNISSYQFRLVGDMTLKQFFQLAGGILVGLIFYSSPLLPIIKWPFAIISVILGIGLAFLPFEERPLEKWIFAFFRAIYSPSLYYWKKTDVPNKFFQDEPLPLHQDFAGQALQDATLQSYIGQDQKKDGVLENLEAAEKSFLSNLTNMFSINKSTNQQINTPLMSTPVTANPNQTPQPLHEAIVGKAELRIPKVAPIKIESDGKPKFVVEEQSPKYQTQISNLQTVPVDPVISGNQVISSRRANFSEEAAPPSASTYNNVLVGQVVDQDRRIVEAAIIEVRDNEGRPIRAIKSNKLGHFITVTPLDNGRYEIVAEKEGYEFLPVYFEAVGTIIQPVLVSAKNLHPEVL